MGDTDVAVASINLNNLLFMLRTFLSTKAVSSTSGSIGLLILRVGVALLMMTHGFAKLSNFSAMSAMFDPIGLGGAFSLSLVIFAEVLCSIALLVGLFTRAAMIPLIINFLVAVFVAHGSDPLAVKEPAIFYLVTYIAILFTGPGKYSIDWYIWDRR